MVTKDAGEYKLESVQPFHEIRRTATSVIFQDQWSYWVLFMPFDGQFHDVSRYNIYEEQMRKFYFHHCYNAKDRKVILC